MKKWLIVCVLAMFGMGSISYAAGPDTQVDALIEKLVDKGILTQDEAGVLKGRISYDAKTIQDNNMKTGLPDWVQNMKFSGDFRLRDQYEHRALRVGTTGATSSNSIYARNRGRFRARLNLEDQINDKVKVTFGIATDGGKPLSSLSSRSNNITFGGNTNAGDGFAKAGIVVNKAYVAYTPNDKITLLGGKMDNPLWEPAVLFWKSDITPEGGAIKLEKKLNDHLTPYATNAWFVLHDQAPSSTLRTMPYILASQAGIKGNLTERAYYKIAGTYYNINNPSHFALTNSTSGINTPSSTSGVGLSYNYTPIIGALDLGLNDPFGEMLPSPFYIPQIGVVGQYGKNLDPSHNNAAWQIGAYMGNSALNGWGTWKLQSFYRVIERDAWLDVLTDDDFYSGYTDTAGWRTQLSIGLAKNVWLDLMYYRAHIYKAFDYAATTAGAALSQKAPESLLQADISFKF